MPRWQYICNINVINVIYNCNKYITFFKCIYKCNKVYKCNKITQCYMPNTFQFEEKMIGMTSYLSLICPHNIPTSISQLVGSLWSPIPTHPRSSNPQESYLKSDCRTSCSSLSPPLDPSPCDTSPLGQTAGGCPVISTQTGLG